MSAAVTPAAVGALLAGGRAGEALALAREAVRERPRDPGWLHLLAIALHAKGASDEAIATLDQALAIAPSDAVALNTRGAIQIERGDLAAAESSLREALRIRGDYAEARFNLALLLRRRGELDAAEAELDRILASPSPLDAARLERATLHIERGDARAALRLLEALLAKYPDDPRALANAAAAHQRLGHEDEALDVGRRALARPNVEPRDIAAVAYTFAALGHEDEAAVAAARAASAAPQSADVRALAADALALAGHNSAARDHYVFAVTKRRDAALLEKLARAALAAGEPARAAEALRESLALAPPSRSASLHLALALEALDQRDEAKAVLAQAIARGATDAEMLSALAFLKSRDCDWEGLDGLVLQVRDAARVPGAFPAFPQHAIYFEGVTPAEQRAWAESWVRARIPQAAALARPPERPGEHRLRVAYFSGDFYDHPTALLMAGMFERHDRDRFEVFGYSWARDDGSPLRERVKKAFDRFVEIRDLSARAAARRVHEDGIDVLVDLGGYVRDARLDVLALRPAPVQVHFLGYPATTGAPFVDFFVADEFTLPHAREGDFTESILRMPGCYQPNERERALPPPIARAACGLPQDALVLCSFNQPVKITRRVFDEWCRLLQALPRSVLWLLAAGTAAEERLREHARAQGVDPARLVFAPRVPQVEHIARLRNADLALDTCPCGSHTTASDALWAGVPLITTAGETFASRVAGSVLHAAGCGEWVFDDRARAFDATLSLARDRDALRQARERLERARATAPLYDADAFARDFEALIEKASHGR